VSALGRTAARDFHLGDRDNGGCPGAIDSNSCSGIKQPTWAFSRVFDRCPG